MPAIQVPTLLTALQEHGLLEPAQLNELGKWPETRAADLRALARKLVQQRWLTAFQINQLAQGKAKELDKEAVKPYLAF